MRSRLITAAVGFFLFACGGDRGPSGPEIPVVASIVVDPSSHTLRWIGATAQLAATPLDAAGQPLSAVVTWTSNDPGIAEVNTAGVVTARGAGATTVIARAGEVSTPVSISVVQDPVSVTKLSGDGQLAEPGTQLTQPLVVEVRDNGGVLVPNAAVYWLVMEGGGTVTPISQQTDAQGRASALWQLGSAGEQSVLVSSGTGSTTFDAGFAGQISITGLVPPTLVEGQEASLIGSGFTPGFGANIVTVDGLVANVQSATATEVRFVVPTSDCRPQRDGEVTLTSSGQQAGIQAEIQPAVTLGLAVGQGSVHASGGCIQLPSMPAGAEYLIGVFSKSQVPSSLTSAYIRSETGVVAGTPLAETGQDVSLAPALSILPVQPLPRGGVAPLDADPALALRALAKQRLWTETERLLREHGPPRPALVAAQALAASVPDVGSTIQLYEGTSCTGRTLVNGLVRHVGPGAIWVEDTANPAGGFSASEWAALDATFTAHTLPVLTQNFGSFSDADANGRIIVLMTRGVNANGGILGYVWSGDLFPQGVCPQSNNAEIFYGIAPDPSGLAGSLTYTTQEVLERYPSLIAHESAHIIQFAHLNANKKGWEFEGGATLAEQLVGMSVMGHGESANLGYTEWNAGDEWYFDWVNDAAFYWGYSQSGKVANAPERCSWIGTAADGNTGPCLNNNRSIYGVPSTLYRFVMDTYGPSYAGGGAALMRALTASSTAGTPSIAQHAAVSENSLLASFYMALWADGWIGEWFTSWDVYDVFQSLPPAARLVPYSSTAASANLNFEIRAGSNGYLHWRPAGGHAAIAIRVRDLGDGFLPGHMVFWILRSS